MKIEIRHVEPEDFKEIQRLHAHPKVIWGTMQLPFPPVEIWRKRLAEKPDGLYGLVACIETKSVVICAYGSKQAPRGAGTSVGWAWRCPINGKEKGWVQR
jgi:hypothetical protein